MLLVLPYIAGLIAAICYGTAIVLEQLGAKKESKIKSLNPLHLLGLLKRSTYFWGIVLDLFGEIFILIAVRRLPLFLVQSFIALSIVVSALLDHYWLKHQIKKNEKIAIGLVLTGLLILSLVAKPGTAIATSYMFKLILVLMPIAFIILGTALVKLKTSKLNSAFIAILAGLAFGATSVLTRMLIFNQIDKQLIQVFMVISIIVYAIIAMILLSIVLQREKINRINSIVTSTEVIGPSIIGIIFLGDGVRGGLWIVLVIGLIFVCTGALFTSSSSKN